MPETLTEANDRWLDLLAARLREGIRQDLGDGLTAGRRLWEATPDSGAVTLSQAARRLGEPPIETQRLALLLERLGLMRDLEEL